MGFCTSEVANSVLNQEAWKLGAFHQPGFLLRWLESGYLPLGACSNSDRPLEPISRLGWKDVVFSGGDTC